MIGFLSKKSLFILTIFLFNVSLGMDIEEKRKELSRIEKEISSYDKNIGRLYDSYGEDSSKEHAQLIMFMGQAQYNLQAKREELIKELSLAKL